ncbi:hypothetical protein KFE25_013650 [Diacronema lutheri]|uniref:Uncharacterized protein n=1 Tax=Diacronema lutheri TaxID=2081491 RepID=A0A8J5XU69_DIALT|nr:hypothetical protein KFE25_013650 [Diacronema lutheri]
MRAFLLVQLALGADAVALRRPGAVIRRTLLLRGPRAPALILQSTAAGGRVGGGDDQNAADEQADAAWTEAEAWTVKVGTPSVQALRADLIAQYLRLGKTHEYAVTEVDAFLSDPARSRSWVRAQELQQMPGWGFGRSSRDDGEAPASSSQVPFLIAAFVGGALLKLAADAL